MRLLCVSFFLWVGFLGFAAFLLGESPDWSRLDKYKGTIGREEFAGLLDEVFVPRKNWRKNWVELDQDAVRIRKQGGKDDWYLLPFANPEEKLTPKLPEEYWRRGDALRSGSGSKALDGFRIALDPGHLGGKFSEMEGRHFVLGEKPPVKEGDLALQVAKRLAKRLRALGAKVSLVRKSAKPITKKRPKSLREEGKAWQKRIDG
ncbi:MAG: hypothetical protein VCA36_12070, partial [Opitutales bacterium]